ncbi:hypothetical protein [Lentilactobacillus rapi]|uniref:hypothetical protein n=1 Tax=Lentilactobacillus rapi TaxID=481723 RepID=UPI001FB435AD|nr:hypothetical protein [Lentilactobacillus rapi]
MKATLYSPLTVSIIDILLVAALTAIGGLVGTWTAQVSWKLFMIVTTYMITRPTGRHSTNPSGKHARR